MISHHLSPAGILTLHPSGPITADDFAALTTTVDTWLEEGNTLKGLLIDAPAFPGWKDFAGLSAHFKFVRDHHREVPRIAFVSDGSFLAALPRIGRHFVHAELRHFPVDQAETALDWLASPPPEKPRAIRHAWFPEHRLFWLRVNGRITTDEYRQWLGEVGDRLNHESPVSFLIDIEDLSGADPGAMLADLKFGLSNLRNIRRIGLIGHHAWCSKIASLPNPFPFEIKAFDETEEYDAWSWITAP